MEYSNKNKILLLVSSYIFCESDEESSDSSSSSSSDNDCLDYEHEDIHAIYFLVMASEVRGEMVIAEKLHDYVERVVAGYSRITFKENFRLLPETFEGVLRLIGPTLNSLPRIGGRKCIDPKKQLLIAIWFMATPDSYRSVCIKFGVGKATAFRALRRVTYALHCFAPRLIQWPKGQRALETTQHQFEAQFGFPGVLGAIDGTHIEVRSPNYDPESYINRKGYHSVILQAVCNSKCLFTHCFAGYPGAVHDARVLRNSPVQDFLNYPEEYFPNDSHLIGDAAYGIHQNMMVPFRDNGHLTLRERNFNYCLSATRMSIERAFGLLKIRFRMLLDCLPLLDMNKIPEFILACCVLHNICILNDDIIDLNVINQDVPLNFNMNNDNINRQLGQQKRNVIMDNLLIRI